MRQRPSLGGALRLSGVALVGLLSALGCGETGRIDGDGGFVPVDSGAVDRDSGGGFRDGGGIGRTDLTLARVVPDHGPFTGGNTVVLRGSGFTDESQVTFGGRNVQPADHRLIDSRRLSVVVPAGEVGPADVAITVGGTTVLLENGYTYDAIAVEPNSGAVAGGTFVTIIGMGTSFQEGDRVLFGRSPCSDVEVVSATRINCRTPPMSAGTVDVVVQGAGAPLSAPDAYTYFDSSDPFSGGLGGGPLAGSVNLTVLDGMTGMPVADAFAILGEDLGTEHQGLTDTLGQITFSGPDIVAPSTIHVAKHCYERTSFVAFDARDVTVFLIPWMDPMCGMGSPPPGGGRGRNGAFVEGQLVWLRDFGSGPAEWFNVPPPRAGWVRAAYVYTTQASLSLPNPDPSLGGSWQRVLEEAPGSRGYPYSVFARPAGLAVYALAGLEETSTGRFVPYVMGVTRNVLAGPGETVPDVDIYMDIPLDHYVEVQLTDLPASVGRFPDRFRLQANIDLAGEGVIVRDVQGQEYDVLRGRDASRPFRFMAQPALFGSLADGRYRIEAGWFTGDFDGQPYTVAVERGITAVDSIVTIGGFLGIPQATAPANGDRLPADRVFRWSADGPDPSFHVVVVIGADGNPAWRMFVPGDVREAPAPDFSSIPELRDMPIGFLTWAVFSITLPGFDFDQLRYGDLNDAFWTRWAVDFYTAQR